MAAAFGILALTIAAAVTTLSGRVDDALRVLSQVNLGYLLVAWLVMTAGMGALALRWRTFFPAGTHAGVVPLTSILFVGLLLSYALPGPVGEVAGAALAHRRFGVRTEAALAAGITARFVGLAMAGLVALIFVESGAVALPPTAGPWIRAATVLLGLGTVALAALAAWPGALRRVSTATVGRLPWFATLHASILRFADALGALGRAGPLTYARGAAWALIGHACVVAGIWVAGAGMGATPDIAGLVFTYAASTAGAIALFVIPGGQLGWDTSFASLLVATAGLDVPSALALTLLVRVQQLSLVILGSAQLLRELRDGTAPLRG